MLGELARTLSLFDPLWASLSPAEQTRVLQLLIDLDTQIMNLLHLAPDIQEAIPFLPRTERGRDPICERMVRPIAAELDMSRQRRI